MGWTTTEIDMDQIIHHNLAKFQEIEGGLFFSFFFKKVQIVGVVGVGGMEMISEGENKHD